MTIGSLDASSVQARAWLQTALVVGGLVFGFGSWAGVIKNGTERLEARMEMQDQQLRDLRSIVSDQNVSIAVLREQMSSMKAQLELVSRAVGARVVP